MTTHEIIGWLTLTVTVGVAMWEIYRFFLHV